MTKTTTYTIRELYFTHLPDFALFVQENRLDEFVKLQIGLSRQLDLPLLKFLRSMPENELSEMTSRESDLMLSYLAENNAKEFIENSIKRWVENKLPVLGQENIQTADLSIISYVRKQALVKLIRDYTDDISLVLDLIDEIDRYVLEYETSAMNTYGDLLKRKINEHVYFIERVTQTSPGIIYVFDLIDRKEVYSNDKLKDLLGYAQEDLQELGPGALAKLMHPADVIRAEEYLEQFGDAQDGEIRSFRYRVKNKDGDYQWMRNYESVFRRTSEGKPCQLIGIALDVDKEKKAAEQLQASEHLYKQAQALTHIGNWSWHIKQNKVEWSDELYRIHGLIPKSEEITFERVLSFIHPEDRKLLSDKVNESLDDKKGYQVYYRLLSESGAIKYILGKGELVLDAAGEPMAIFGTAQDITDQYNTQKLLEENQKYIEKITDAAPSLIIAYNVQTGEYMFVSKGIERLLGYKAKQVLQGGSAFFTNIVHPDDVLPVRETIRKALDTANNNESIDKKGIVLELIYRIKHQNGQYRHFQTYGTILDRDASGKVEQLLNISVDITDKVEAEQKIKEQEHFIKHIADASPTILYVFDLEESRVIYINKEIESVLGYTPGEIEGMKGEFYNSLFHAEDFEKNRIEHNKLTSSSGSSSVVEYEARMKHKTGGWRHVVLKEIVFKRDAVTNEVTQVLCAALNITERKEMEKALFDKTMALHQSNKSLEEFAYVASHDLKEPLRKISAFGDRLINSQKDKLDSNGQFFLNKIIDSSKRMNTMIDDLLSLSMISGEKEFEEYSLQSILDEVLQTLEFKIEKRGAIITSDLLPAANIVPAQFRQLFQNLLSNALKFVAEDVQPVIRITYEMLAAKEVGHFNLGKSSQYIKLQFIDNGIGFEPEYGEKIFVVFQRLHGKSEFEGTGIGLAICKKIVENHGGVVYARSSAGNGSTFTVIIPALNTETVIAF